jgi:hypothetical protein
MMVVNQSRILWKYVCSAKLEPDSTLGDTKEELFASCNWLWMELNLFRLLNNIVLDIDFCVLSRWS